MALHRQHRARLQWGRRSIRCRCLGRRGRFDLWLGRCGGGLLLGGGRGRGRQRRRARRGSCPPTPVPERSRYRVQVARLPPGCPPPATHPSRPHASPAANLVQSGPSTARPAGATAGAPQSSAARITACNTSWPSDVRPPSDVSRVFFQWGMAWGEGRGVGQQLGRADLDARPDPSRPNPTPRTVTWRPNPALPSPPTPTHQECRVHIRQQHPSVATGGHRVPGGGCVGHRALRRVRRRRGNDDGARTGAESGGRQGAEV